MKRHLEKLKKARRLLRFAMRICALCRSLGLSYLFEHPWGAESWEEKAVVKVMNFPDTLVARGDQCMMGLKSITGTRRRKRTGFMTNNKEIARALNLQCSNDHEHSHIIGSDEGGKISAQSQKYPQGLIDKVLKAYGKNTGDEAIITKATEKISEDREFDTHYAEDLKGKQRRDQGADLEDWEIDLPDEDEDLEIFDVDNDDEEAAAEVKEEKEDKTDETDEHEKSKAFPGSHPMSLERLVKRAHEGLGHPSKERFLRILKHAKAEKKVLDIAKNLSCSTCERHKLTRPTRQAAPPRELGVNEYVGVDSVWLPTHLKKPKIALNIVDWGTHFQLVVPLKDHTPAATREAYRQWIRFFGPPKVVKSDLGKEFDGHFSERAETDGSVLDPGSLEAPQQRGITERNGKTFKSILAKAIDTYSCSSWSEWRELVDVTCMTKNRLLMRGGFSPIQRVIGYSPKLPGGIMSDGAKDLPTVDKLRIGDEGVRRSMEMRKAAAKAFIESDCEQALRSASLAGPRPSLEYEVGQTVYFWRRGVGKTKHPSPAYWHGPATVVMTHLPSTVWCAYQGYVVKGAPERLRLASEEELLSVTGWLEGITEAKKFFEKPMVRGFIDIKDEPMPPTEDGDTDDEQGGEHAEDQTQKEGPAPARRVRRKTGDYEQKGPTEEEEQKEPSPTKEEAEEPKATTQEEPPNKRNHPEAAPSEAAASSRKSNRASKVPRTDPATVSRDQEETMPEAEPEIEEQSPPAETRRRDDEDEEDQPPTKKTRVDYIEIYMAKLDALRKQREKKECKIKDFHGENLKRFRRAMSNEINSNLQTGAYRIMDIPASLDISKNKAELIMDSRYVFNRKALAPEEIEAAVAADLHLQDQPDGDHKAKCRHVMKGFSEPGVLDRETTTPQISRDAVVVQTQILASSGWEPAFLDFTQAFHSGDAIDRELYCRQPREGIPGADPRQILRLEKTCYGLTDGPAAWYRHISKVLLDFGYEKSKADPCWFHLFQNENDKKTLKGTVCLATDDMYHGGGARHWKHMEELRRRYKMGKYIIGKGRFCGKDFEKLPDGSIKIDQTFYTQKQVVQITLDKKRSARRYSPCSPAEVEALRGLIGTLAWLAKETRPDLAGKVSLVQQTFPRPRIKDIVQANKIAEEATEHADIGILVKPIPLDRLRVGTVTDAAWGNAKDPGDDKHTAGKDTWEETQTQWIRHHADPRCNLFHPGLAAKGGPDLHDLQTTRRTFTNDDAGIYEDTWTSGKEPRAHRKEAWTGKTEFDKNLAGKPLSSTSISDGFLQMVNLSSQGGFLIIFYDSDLTTSQKLTNVTVAAWKSYRLKRKTVNTLSAECQSLIHGVGSLHWHRLMLLECFGDHVTDFEWEKHLATLPFMAVVDSKSLYDCVSKCNNPASHVEDKRTAIDIAILRNDFQKSNGQLRWVDTRAMMTDPLTKDMKGDYLRHVLKTGQWSVLEEGVALQRKALERSTAAEIFFVFHGLSERECDQCNFSTARSNKPNISETTRSLTRSREDRIATSNKCETNRTMTYQ